MGTQKHKMVSMAVVVSMMSGLESFVKRELEALADRGYALRLFATKYSPSPGFEPRTDIPFHVVSTFEVIRGAVLWGLRNPILFFRLLKEAIVLRGVVEFALALSWAAKLRNVDIIHCAFGDRKYFVGYFMHRLTGLPLTVAIHAHEIYAQPNELLFRHALNYTCGVVTISAKNAMLISEKYDIALDKIDVIRLTIDLDFWHPRSDEVNVLTVARFTPRKGWHELIEAAKYVDRRFNFYAVGFGELDIVALAEAAGVGERFTVFQKLQPKHIRLLMQSCDIFCLPSKQTDEEGSEGIPVVLMEAMAMGMEIVTTDDGSIRELVEHAVIPPADVNALVGALNSAALHFVRREVPMNVENRKRVTAMHNADNLDQLDAFFRRKIRAYDSGID